jgi:hypothetical protein
LITSASIAVSRRSGDKPAAAKASTTAEPPAKSRLYVINGKPAMSARVGAVKRARG